MKMQDSTIYMGLFRLFNVLDNFQLCEKILFPYELSGQQTGWSLQSGLIPCEDGQKVVGTQVDSSSLLKNHEIHMVK